MSNGTAIVETLNPLVLLQPNLRFPRVPPMTTTTLQSGVILHNCRVKYVNHNAMECPCSGSMCDYSEFTAGYGRTPATVCACVRGQNMGRTTCISVSLSIEEQNTGVSLSVEGFTSKMFYEQFLVRSSVARMNPQHFHANGIIISKKIKKILKYGNTRGGWSIVGWQKTSLVEDQGGQEQGASINGSGNQVIQGHSNFHIIRMEPSVPNSFNRDELHNLKIDLTELM
eukprot:scaffold12895_cov164-Skeletonema_dohrnii-CCMP3373.AAC.5